MIDDYHHPATSPGDLFDYGQHAAETKKAAHDAAKPKQNARRELALAELRKAGRRGHIRHTWAQSCGLPLQSICSVALSLLRDGLARETGEKRETPTGSMAAVIVATDCEVA
jgi:hypothetical protein